MAKLLRKPEFSDADVRNAIKSLAEEPISPEITDGPLRELGEYVLISELGRGGMGVVYRAMQPGLGRQVAIKQLLRPKNPKHESRFRREMRALGKVDHPNLVKIFSSAADGESWFYVMELVEGASLAAVMEKLSTPNSPTAIDLPAWNAAVSTAAEEQRNGEKPLSGPQSANNVTVETNACLFHRTRGPVRCERQYVNRIVTLAKQVAEASHALHCQGIIHRDIKPGNILVDNAGERATLMDLGLAQLADEVDPKGKVTETRQFVGTWRYASPEQVRADAPVDARSDVYSLGATLWEMLALQPILEIKDAMPRDELMDRILYDEPRRLRRCNLDVSRDLDAVVHKCLEKRAKHRYGSAQELADDLDRYLIGEPVRARHVGWMERRLKWVQRHPQKAGNFALMAVSFLLASLTASAGFLWWSEAEQRRHIESLTQLERKSTERKTQSLMEEIAARDRPAQALGNEFQA
ncbi:MAG: serine/threonine protein kinase, partial [Candidatus Acidiferrum sp.]